MESICRRTAQCLMGKTILHPSKLYTMTNKNKRPLCKLFNHVIRVEEICRFESNDNNTARSNAFSHKCSIMKVISFCLIDSKDRSFYPSNSIKKGTSNGFLTHQKAKAAHEPLNLLACMKAGRHANHF